MCIIIAKEKGIALPTSQQYEKCMFNNPDGVGYMYHRNNESSVHIRKGFMKLEDLYRSFHKNKINADDTVIIHFRKGTSGTVVPQNTHPFPVSSQKEHLFSLNIQTQLGVAHEGVLFSYGTDDLTDSQDFVLQVLSDPKIHKNLDKPVILKLLKSALGLGDSLAFMDKNGNITMIGSWHETKEIWFSNYKYLYNSNYTSNITGYDDFNGWSGNYWDNQATISTVYQNGESWYICPACAGKVVKKADEFLHYCKICGAIFNKWNHVLRVNIEEVHKHYEGIESGNKSQQKPIIFRFLGLDWYKCPICKEKVATREHQEVFYCKKCGTIFGKDYGYYRTDRKDVRKHYRTHKYDAYDNPEYYNVIKLYYEEKRKRRVERVENETSE